LTCRRRPAARSSTSRAHEDVLPSAALSSLERSASVRQILSMFVCRSFGFLGGRPAMPVIMAKEILSSSRFYLLHDPISMAIIIADEKTRESADNTIAGRYNRLSHDCTQ
jgi:hypothetical protein